MRQKLKPIDFNILSSYLGKYITALVSVLVVVLTVSAYLTGPDGDEAVRVCLDRLPFDRDGKLSEVVELFSLRAKPRLVLTRCGLQGEGQEVRLLSLARWLEEAHGNASPLFALTYEGREPEAALLVARGKMEVEKLAEMGAVDLVVANPHSFSAYWVQVDYLLQMGVDRAHLQVHFADDRVGGGYVRALLELLGGNYQLAACRRSDLNYLQTRDGSLADELFPVAEIPLPPLLVIAAKRDIARGLRQRLAPLTKPVPGQWGLSTLSKQALRRAKEVYRRVRSAGMRGH